MQVGETKVVGILGGMGPLATVEFFRRLVVASPAEHDQQHLHILIDNNPHVPDRTAAIVHGGPSPAPRLAAMAQRLEVAGAHLLAMPCNTAHVYVDEIQRSVSIPTLDMIHETVARIGQPSIGLLATDGTIQTRLYQKACDLRGIGVILPPAADQRLVMEAIERVKKGENPRRVGENLSPIIGRMKRAGAEAVIAGCTEISLVHGDEMPVAWIDALDCLVDATLREASPSGYREDGQEET